MRKYPYSIGAAISYAVVLLLTLWWLPVIGPIVIGYITGRKAGGPVKGVVAMSVPILLYFAFIFAVSQGLVHIPFIFSTNFIGSIVSILHSLPIFSFLSYIDATLKLAMHAGTYFENYLYYAPPSFFIMLSFSFIGGAVSRMVILERGIFPEKKSWLVKKERISGEDVPQPFHAKVITAQPVRRIRPFIIPEDDTAKEEEPEENEKEERLVETKKSGGKKERRIFSSKTHRVKRGPKRFDEEENAKFVVHPVEEPKPVVLSKKKINREHSLTYL